MENVIFNKSISVTISNITRKMVNKTKLLQISRIYIWKLDCTKIVTIKNKRKYSLYGITSTGLTLFFIGGMYYGIV
jgi:hypothetical protein